MGVARVVKIGSPYHGEQVPDIDFEQTTDTMYLAHIDHSPTKLVRNSHTDWEFVTLTFGPDIAAPTGLSVTATIANTDSENDGNAYFPQPASYVITAVSDDTGQESRASASDTDTNDLTLKRNYNSLSWSAVTGADRYNVYKADNSQFYGYIGSTESTSFRDDNLGPALDNAPPLGYNPFEGDGNNPSVVSTFEQRLFWGRTRNRPNALFGSRQGTTEYENFDKSRPLKASDSFDLAMTGKRVNTINQVVPSDQLLALTTDGIFQIDGDGQGGVLTATQRAARKIVGRGASRLEPIVIDNVVFHTPAVGSAIRTLGYSFEFDGIRSNDVSIFSPHLFEGHLIVSWCYVEFPHSRIWAARDDGVLLCLTWEQEQQVWGITRHETDGLVKWVASISEEGEDRLYLAVERRVGSQNQVLIERMASALEVAREDQCFCDSAISYAYDDARASFTNLHHLNGRTDVVGLIDGVAIAGLTVVNGILTLPNGLTARRATFGLPYTADVQTLPLRVSDRDGGSAVGKRQQSATIVYDLSGTGPGIEAGATFGTLYPVKNRTDETYGGPLSYLNGRYEVETANTLGDEAEACLRSALPYPLTLLGVYVDPLTAD